MALRRVLLAMPVYGVAGLSAGQTRSAVLEFLSDLPACGLEPAALSAKGIRASASWEDARATFQTPPNSTLTTFFHQGEAFDFRDLKDCYYDAIGGNYKLDLKVWPLDAEHATDVPLLNLLAHHGSRVFDPTHATIQVVGAPVNTAYLTTELEGSPCGSAERFTQQLHGLRQALDSLPAWQNQSSRFLFVDTDWRAKRAFEAEAEILQKSKVTLACADRVINDNFAQATSCVVIPYRAHFLLDSEAQAFARVESDTPTSVNASTAEELQKARPIMFHYDAPRDVAVTFNGNMKNRWHNETDREVLMDVVAGIENASVQNIDFQNFTTEEYVQIGMDTANTMLRSMFCFVPAGDTPTTRRLFDALAAGCVPIVIAKVDDIADNLPFKNTINWGDIAIFIDELQCVQDKQQAVNDWLHGLLETPEKVRHFEEMRTLGRRVFAKYLSFDSAGMVDALLAEFNEKGEPY